MVILTNTEACCGCRICELMCSFHHNKTFSSSASSIKVSRDNQNGEIKLSINSTCDLCIEEAGPLCVEYCVYGALDKGGTE